MCLLLAQGTHVVPCLPLRDDSARDSQCARTVSALRAMGMGGGYLGARERVHTWRGILRRRLLRLLVQRVELELLGVGEQVRRQLARVHDRILKVSLHSQLRLEERLV